jgi:L,D-transpeptidase-like protein
MARLVVASAFAIGAFLLGSAAPQPQSSPRPSRAGSTLVLPHSPLRLEPAGYPRIDQFALYSGPQSLRPLGPLDLPPPPPSPSQALRHGVLVVVSLASQSAFVFRNGQPWDSTPVSTGKPGHETPVGVFPILEKDTLHRSTLYEDAPMPFMQRITWDGVALHAGHVPGFPASHGCIRLPKPFAEKLFAITNFSSTVVVVTHRQLASAEEARKLA